MEQFFRVGHILVDVERGLIIDTYNAKQMEVNLAEYHVKDFNKRVSHTPIRITNDGSKTQVLQWDKGNNKWVDFRKTHGEDIGMAMEKYVNLQIEGDLLT